MQPGNRTGTPNYMAPEFVRRRKTDRRVDIFAFGVTAYEMLTFQLPWPGSDTTGQALAHDTLAQPPAGPAAGPEPRAVQGRDARPVGQPGRPSRVAGSVPVPDPQTGVGARLKAPGTVPRAARSAGLRPRRNGRPQVSARWVSTPPKPPTSQQDASRHCPGRARPGRALLGNQLAAGVGRVAAPRSLPPRAGVWATARLRGNTAPRVQAPVVVSWRYQFPLDERVAESNPAAISPPCSTGREHESWNPSNGAAATNCRCSDPSFP